MGLLVAVHTQNYQILGGVVSKLAPPLKVVNLKIVHSSAILATPAVSLQDFSAKLAIKSRFKPYPGSLGTNASQTATRTLSISCLLCGAGRPSTSRVSEARRASWLPVSKLTPARKSAQIISKQ